MNSSAKIDIGIMEISKDLFVLIMRLALLVTAGTSFLMAYVSYGLLSEHSEYGSGFFHWFSSIPYFVAFFMGVAWFIWSVFYNGSTVSLFKDEITMSWADYSRMIFKKKKTYFGEFSINCEKDLQLLLWSNFKNSNLYLDGRLLTLLGLEYNTSIGKIDILAESGDTLYIIELKAGKRTSDRVVGQVLRYYEYCKRNLTNYKHFKAIIIAGEINDKLLHSVGSVPQIDLYQWHQFKDCDLLIEKIDKLPSLA